MSNRFGRDNARNQLFAGYDASSSASRTQSTSPRPKGGYGYSNPNRNTSPSSASRSSSNPAFGAYPGASGGQPSPPYANGNGSPMLDGSGSKLRSATPNRKGQYSDAVLSELESQNDEQMEGMSAKVKMLKTLTSAIGEEIRDSTALAEKMNDSFENTRVRLRGTMNRMLRMAEKTGVPWKYWLLFFAAVILLFWYVRLT